MHSLKSIGILVTQYDFFFKTLAFIYINTSLDPGRVLAEDTEIVFVTLVGQYTFSQPLVFFFF